MGKNRKKRIKQPGRKHRHSVDGYTDRSSEKKIEGMKGMTLKQMAELRIPRKNVVYTNREVVRDYARRVSPYSELYDSKFESMLRLVFGLKIPEEFHPKVNQDAQHLIRQWYFKTFEDNQSPDRNVVMFPGLRLFFNETHTVWYFVQVLGDNTTRRSFGYSSRNIAIGMLNANCIDWLKD